VRARLNPGGVVVINVGHPEDQQELEQVLSRTLETSFAHVVRDPVKDVNTLLVASASPITAEKLRASLPGVDPELRPIAEEVASRLAPALPGGEVYTDDRAPVEWLIDKSIVDYASGE
jgi:hypothetical protein